jgi:hypothetical protein
MSGKQFNKVPPYSGKSYNCQRAVHSWCKRLKLPKITCVKLHALANTTKSPNWWKGLVQSTYTLQHPHSRVTGEEKVNTWTQINCENQDLNTRPWALIPCQASCTSQRNQKSELMERASTIHLYTSTTCLWESQAFSKFRTNWDYDKGIQSGSKPKLVTEGKTSMPDCTAELQWRKTVWWYAQPKNISSA